MTTHHLTSDDMRTYGPAVAHTPVDHRFEVATATLAAVERVTLGDVQRVAEALSLDEIELVSVVEAARERPVSAL